MGGERERKREIKRERERKGERGRDREGEGGIPVVPGGL